MRRITTSQQALPVVRPEFHHQVIKPDIHRAVAPLDLSVVPHSAPCNASACWQSLSPPPPKATTKSPPRGRSPTQWGVVKAVAAPPGSIVDYDRQTVEATPHPQSIYIYLFRALNPLEVVGRPPRPASCSQRGRSISRRMLHNDGSGTRRAALCETQACLLIVSTIKTYPNRPRPQRPLNSQDM